MKNLNVFFYAIYSNTSRNGGGLQYEAMLTSRDGIIEAADSELRKSGESLEDLAGIKWIANEEDEDKSGYEREITPEEVLKFSIVKLGDDGRHFEIFNDDEEGIKKFKEAAEGCNLSDRAEKLLS